MIKVSLSGDALEQLVDLSTTIYQMQVGYNNEHRYWKSNFGNVIWHEDGNWNIGTSESLGTILSGRNVSLYLSADDPSSCPSDKHESKWIYYNGSQFVEDTGNLVSVQCVPSV